MLSLLKHPLSKENIFAAKQCRPLSNFGTFFLIVICYVSVYKSPVIRYHVHINGSKYQKIASQDDLSSENDFPIPIFLWTQNSKTDAAEMQTFSFCFLLTNIFVITSIRFKYKCTEAMTIGGKDTMKKDTYCIVMTSIELNLHLFFSSQ